MSHPGALQLRRLEVLMDVVFAILIWRIVTLLPRPTEDEVAVDTLLTFLGNNNHNFLVIFIGIVLVIVYWIQNNGIFGRLAGTDNRHTVISFVQLFFLLLYLYSVRLGIQFEGQTLALLLQSTTLALAGFTAIVGWRYAVKERRLLLERVSEEDARQFQIGILAEPVTALLTIPFAFVGQGAWDLSWLLYLVVAFILKRRTPTRPSSGR
jgi:uncharacterized membrane protein